MYVHSRHHWLGRCTRDRPSAGRRPGRSHLGRHPHPVRPTASGAVARRHWVLRGRCGAGRPGHL